MGDWSEIVKLLGAGVGGALLVHLIWARIHLRFAEAKEDETEAMRELTGALHEIRGILLGRKK